MANYRLATEKDLIVLAEMRWDFRTEYADTPPPMGKQGFVEACVSFLKKGLALGQWAYWVAEVGEEIVSHFFVQRIRKVPKPSRLVDEYGYVTNVYTRPAYRGQGIGGELLQHVKAWAQEEDLELLIVWPSERSISFYERSGFRAENQILECEIRPYVQ